MISATATASDHYNFCAKYSQLSSIPSSPERRFKSISPCRRLFEELSTNQNSPCPSGFVVSNGNLATPNSSFSNFNHNNNNNNYNSNSNNNIDNSSFQNVLVTKSILGGQQNNFEVEGLTDILYSSYQRKRSINGTFNTNNINCNNSNLLSSPFMDDLGFLSTTTSTATTGTGTNSMKKNSLVIYENDENGCDQEILMSSPMKIKEIPMKSCSIRKHWNNRKTTSFTGRRRAMSECFTSVQMSENGLIHHLPCFDSPHDAIKRISPDTLVELLEQDGKFFGFYERIFIIDCRYPYEYEGGHIPTAINVNSPDLIEQLLMDEPQGNTLIVFHCEFSSERAPRMALHVRSLDRQLNTANYPSLYYPEMYILEGGYKNFWQQHGEKCEPPHAYLPMRNPQYRDQLRHHQKQKYAFKSGCHLSQHSAIKSLPPKSKKPRSKSLNVANARKFFNDLISGNNEEGSEVVISEDAHVNMSSSPAPQQHPRQNHMFPSYTIPMSNSFSSIFASELDIPSEMDLE